MRFRFSDGRRAAVEFEAWDAGSMAGAAIDAAIEFRLRSRKHCHPHGVWCPVGQLHWWSGEQWRRPATHPVSVYEGDPEQRESSRPGPLGLRRGAVFGLPGRRILEDGEPSRPGSPGDVEICRRAADLWWRASQLSEHNAQQWAAFVGEMCRIIRGDPEER